jgi:putative nucleotidyltransferase with HDIG domain
VVEDEGLRSTEAIGVIGVLAFTLPLALILVSIRLYVARTRAAIGEAQQENEALREANAELRNTHLATIAALSRHIEATGGYTGGHTERVAPLAVAIADRLGLSAEEREAVETGALLHDIGKIGIPERILHKPGPLDDEEWEVMKEHPEISDRILAEVNLHPIVRQIARWSHERIDGHGYPDGLAGEQIPLAARIVLVADAYDAITSDRPYRRGRDAAAALAELHAHAGTQFCPTVLAALEQIAFEEPQLLEPATPPAARLASVA